MIQVEGPACSVSYAAANQGGLYDLSQVHINALRLCALARSGAVDLFN
jgi:hypothetical protein